MVLPVSQQGLYQDGNSIFEDLHVTNALHYDFKKSGNIEVKNINVVGVITATEFSGVDSTALKDTSGTVQIQGTTTGATHAGLAVFNNIEVDGYLEVEGELRDGDGNFGTSGQVLSSDGTDTRWVNTGSLTAGAASEVGITAVNTDSDHFITFVDSSSGNENVRVDNDLLYNPSTNTLGAINIASAVINGALRLSGQLQDGDGNFGTSGQVLSSDGTDTRWVNAGTLTAGAASEVGVTASDNATGDHFITFVDSSSGNENIRVDTGLTYVPSTNTISATFSGNGSALTQLDASNISSGTINDNRLPNSISSNITGNAATADDSDLLQGENGNFYRNANNINNGTLNTDRLPNTYTKAAGVTIQATGAGNDVRLDAADHIIFEAGEEEDGAIYFRGNSGTDSYRFAKSGTGNEGTEGFLNFDNLTSDRTYTFPNAGGTIALTSSNITGTSGGFTAGSASFLDAGTLPTGRIGGHSLALTKIQEITGPVFLGRNNANTGDIEQLDYDAAAMMIGPQIIRQVKVDSDTGTQYYQYYQGPINTGLSVSITTAANSNRVLIFYSVYFSAATNSSSVGIRPAGSRLQRNGTTINVGSGGSNNQGGYTSTSDSFLTNHTNMCLDNVNAGTYTYTVQIRHHMGGSYGNRLCYNRSFDGNYRCRSQLVVMEVID